jgi:methylated-DNA-[protein]-cysteine S-methyltransferase
VSFLFDRIPTPLGEAQLVCATNGSIHLFGWYDHDRWRSRFVDLAPASDPFGYASAILKYFGGEVAGIDALPVVFSGTAFQVKVWAALRAIPAGETESYGALAKRIGDAKAVRAVGLANGANPIGLIVPCHRVIGSDGSLTGYGGGLDRKKWLLTHEARYAGHGLFGKEAMR